MVSDANEADARALPNGLVALNAPPGEAWRSSAGATPAGGARDPLRRVPRCDTRALVRNAGRRGTRPRRRCRRSSLACAPSSCGRYDADATVRFRWTERARRRAAPPRAKLAKPFQLKFAFSARPTSVTRLRRRLETPPSSPPPPPPPVAVAHSLARNPGVIGRIARTRRPRRAWSAWRASALDGAASHAERQRRRRRSDSRG